MKEVINQHGDNINQQRDMVNQHGIDIANRKRNINQIRSSPSCKRINIYGVPAKQRS